jgi:hypothetical protein
VRAFPEVLHAEADHHAVVPEKFIYDTAASNGKTHAWVTEVTEGQTQLVAPLPPTHTLTGKFTPDRFQLSEDTTTLTYPNQQMTILAYQSSSGYGRLFRFLGLQCHDCPVWELCRTQQPGPKRLRQVFTLALGGTQDQRSPEECQG